MVKKLLFLFLGIYFSPMALAQNTGSENQRNHQIWIDIYPHYYMNKKLEYYGDGGYRTILNERSWSRVYARPSIKYHFNKNWEIQSGLGIFYIFNTNDVDLFEITPWQGGQWNWVGLKHFKFKNLVKIEERWSFPTDSWKADFELRFRYKLSIDIIFPNENWSMPIYGEMFYPLSGKIQEVYQNKGRGGIGVSYKYDKGWKFTFLFNLQRSKSGRNEEVSVSDFVYQIQIRKVWKRHLIKTKYNQSQNE